MALSGDYQQLIFIDSSHRNRQKFPHPFEFEVNIDNESKSWTDPLGDGYPIFTEWFDSVLVENGETVIKLRTGVPIDFFENNLLNKYASLFDTSWNLLASSRIKGFYKLRPIFTFIALTAISSVDSTSVYLNNAIASSSNNIYNGMYLYYSGSIDPDEIAYGASDNRYFQIMSYDGATKTAIVSPSITYTIQEGQPFSLLDANSVITGFYVEPINESITSGRVIVRQLGSSPYSAQKCITAVQTLALQGTAPTNLLSKDVIFSTNGRIYRTNVLKYDTTTKKLLISINTNWLPLIGTPTFQIGTLSLFGTFTSYNLITPNKLLIVGGSTTPGIYNGMYIRNNFNEMSQILSYTQDGGGNWILDLVPQTYPATTENTLVNEIWSFNQDTSFVTNFTSTFDVNVNMYWPTATSEVIGMSACIYHPLISNPSDFLKRESRFIVGFDDFSKVITLSTSSNPVNYVPEYYAEIFRNKRNNEHSLSLLGGVANRGSPCNYTMSLNWIRIPRYPIFVDDIPSMKKLINEYPYVIVELQNKNSATSNAVFGNNPNIGKGQFIVSLDDNSTGIGKYITFKSSAPITLKFNPNDTLHFSVRLPDGTPLKFDMSDEMYSPKQPNESLQVSALFSIKRELYSR